MTSITRCAALSRPSSEDLNSLIRSFASINVSSGAGSDADTKAISKRIWRFDPASTVPTGDDSPSFNDASTYLVAVFNGHENNDFGPPGGLSTTNPPDERAYSQQAEFGNNKFQFMTGGIHGCTTITLVSNRAVWMAHFWETYSMRIREDKKDCTKENSDEPVDHPVVVERILEFIRGNAVPNPAPNFLKPYLTPEGPFIQVDLFNRQDTDETKLFISTPTALGVPITRSRFQYRYPLRIKKMAEAVAERIGLTPEVDLIPYQALDYSDPQQFSQAGTNARGHHLFQFDPDSDGNGQRAWRLFAEHRYRVKNVP
ncbi:hypothetical protein BDV96DRAFT_644273 [Lophiotrema nucula]|uniref:Uncharacterized protein n=1 Tax=Lophiotrema nucula TaxID=690887 RepID=A0A6A5ZFC0_9PLEO|nr:hypothetical protein BDV96DRAFT_644273 [Lophiotrema nucula]